MIDDLALRWIVTAMFVFSAGVCLAGAARGHTMTGRLSHVLHAVMAVAMAVMAWPKGAELPARAPMIFFLAAAAWFVVVTVREAGHRVANGYHTLMMLAMAWMYAVMGGVALPQRVVAVDTAVKSGGHAGHGGHSGQVAAMADGPAVEPAAWVVGLNWLCALGFGAATAFWLYTLVTARLSADESRSTVGVLCQLAMAAGMAIMFTPML